jgi:AcrR family transcriptional regulator
MKKSTTEQKRKSVQKHHTSHSNPQARNLGDGKKGEISIFPPKSDRRINRTRQILFRAFSELVFEKGYDDITIREIIDRADVGRSTFYVHFQDKEDLAVSNLIQQLDLLTESVEQRNSNSHNFLPGRDFFEHIRENYPTFKAMTSRRGLDLFFQTGQKYWSQRVITQLQAMLPAGQEASVPVPILAHYVSGAFIILLKWWIDNKMPYTSDYMAEIAEQLITPSIQAGLLGRF